MPDEKIIKGYEHAKGHHVLIRPKELDDLKLEAKHTIDWCVSWTTAAAMMSNVFLFIGLPFLPPVRGG